MVLCWFIAGFIVFLLRAGRCFMVFIGVWLVDIGVLWRFNIMRLSVGTFWSFRFFGFRVIWLAMIFPDGLPPRKTTGLKFGKTFPLYR